jgi:hypothetical protein
MRVSRAWKTTLRWLWEVLTSVQTRLCGTMSSREDWAFGRWYVSLLQSLHRGPFLLPHSLHPACRSQRKSQPSYHQLPRSWSESNHWLRSVSFSLALINFIYAHTHRTGGISAALQIANDRPPLIDPQSRVIAHPPRAGAVHIVTLASRGSAPETQLFLSTSDYCSPSIVACR